MNEEIVKIKEQIEQKRQQYLTIWLFLMVGIALYFGVLFYYVNVKVVAYINFAAILVLFSGYVIITTRKLLLKSALDFGVVGCVLTIYMNSLVFWKDYPISYIWYVLVVFVSYTVQSIRSVIIWIVLCTLLYLSTPYVAGKLGLNYPMNFSDEVHDYIIYSNVFIFVGLMAISFYYLNAFQKLRIKKASVLYNGEAKSSHDENVNNIESERNTPEKLAEKKTKEAPIDEAKLLILYSEIEKYFEEHKPYQDPEFNTYKLALGLNANISQLSKAISLKNGFNFNKLTNMYRIKEVKKNIEDGEHKKFTLKHIYQNAGFTSQTTFNRAFKEVEGMSPTAFIEQLK